LEIIIYYTMEFYYFNNYQKILSYYKIIGLPTFFHFYKNDGDEKKK
jgi:hypothetical protein